MATWEIIADEVTYSLSDGNPFKLVGVTGIGNAPVRRLEERGPFQDGSTDIGYRLDARLMNLSIVIFSNTNSLAEQNRTILSKIFNPRSGAPVQLRYTRDDGLVRQIDCHAVAQIDTPFDLQSRILTTQRVSVQLKAPDPLWYNPNKRAFFGTVSEDFAEWETVNGLLPEPIEYARMIGTGGTPWAGMGTVVDDGSYQSFSIYARTSVPTDADKYLFSYLTAGTPAGTAYFKSTGGGSVAYCSGTSEPVIFNAWPSGTVSLWIESQRALQYVDGTVEHAIESINARVQEASYQYGWVAPFEGLASNGSATWGTDISGGNAWGNDILFAAVYPEMVSEDDKDALFNLTSGTGSATLIATADVYGDWDTYPSMRIDQEFTSPVIKNLTTGEKLDFTGLSLVGQSGKLPNLMIDLEYGSKRAYLLYDDSNAIPYLSEDSDLGTFHLVPGRNVLTVSLDPGEYPSQVWITYYDRFLGI
jgi:hypothetical protein